MKERQHAPTGVRKLEKRSRGRGKCAALLRRRHGSIGGQKGDIVPKISMCRRKAACPLDLRQFAHYILGKLPRWFEARSLQCRCRLWRASFESWAGSRCSARK